MSYLDQHATPSEANDTRVICAYSVATMDAQPYSRDDDAERSGDGVLSARDREILAFERQWWKYAGAKEQAVRELFDMSATRYYQVLNALIDTPEALEADPMLVKRLRRLRASRQRARSARRLGINV
jgi:Protein of unknown function (DUF3263)